MITRNGHCGRQYGLIVLLAAVSLPQLTAQEPTRIELAATDVGAAQPSSKEATSNLTKLESPPFMVEIEAGDCFVGTETATVKKFLKGKFAGKFDRSFTAEQPGKQARVPGFWVQLTETTNRQYQEFLQATKGRPPLAWFHEAIKVARAEHVREEGARKKRKEEAGQEYDPVPFDEIGWWKQNWKTATWNVPEGTLDHPANHISFNDAVNYCAWAGLRLPTEEEWSRAARGSKKTEYIWGDEWDPDRCLNLEISRNRLKRVASYPKGASEFGVLDLAGSLYEWTSSPYTAFPGFEPLKNKEQERILPKFDPSMRVVKGGSYAIAKPDFACRVGHRLRAPTQAFSEQIGFRPVRSAQPGLDHMTNLLKFQVPMDLLGGGVEINASKVVGEEAWTIESQTESGIPQYGVIKKHHHMFFAPVTQVRTVTPRALHAASLKIPVTLGVLSISEAVEMPGLGAGTYVVMYRGAGKEAGQEQKKNGKEEKAKPEKKDDGGKAEEEKKKPEKKKKKRRETRKERLQREKEEAERKVAEEKKKQEEAAQKALEEAQKKIDDEKKKQGIETGDVPSLQEIKTEEIEVDHIEFDREKENLLFCDVKTGAIVCAVSSTKAPLAKVNAKRGEAPKSTWGVYVEPTTDEENPPQPVRRFKIVVPTTSSSVYFEFVVDVSPE